MKVTHVGQPQVKALYDQSSSALREAVRRLVGERPAEWDDFLDPLLFLFRTSAHPVTKFTPYYLMFNREPRMPNVVRPLTRFC